MKKCFSCRWVLPLFFYSDNKRNYQLPSDKGKNICCKICQCKRIIKQKKYLQFNFSKNNYDLIIVDDVLKHIIKTILEK